MKITVVGCGNFRSFRNYHQSFLLEETKDNVTGRLLVDCGSRTPLALQALGIPLESIDAFYVSHAHADHCGGIEEVAFARYDWANKPRRWDDYKFPGPTEERPYIKEGRKYKRYAPVLLANEELMEELWASTFKGGLRSMEGFPSELATFFEPKPVTADMPIRWMDWTIELVQQIHIITGNRFAHTYGLFLTKPGHKKVYITTDSQHCSPRQIAYFYSEADIILQDCETAGIDTKAKAVDFSTGVHANYGQLAGWPSVNAERLPDSVKKKMLLSHYNDFVSEGKDYKNQACDWDAMATSDGFAGFVQVGQVLEV